MEELRRRVYEVENLREQQEQQCLAEMSENGDAGEGHTRDITVGVADEEAGRKAILRK